MLNNIAFKRLCRARDRLREPREAPLSIAAIAREAGMSPFHFIRQFQALFGSTPHQLRIQARIDHAKLLLAGDDHSVTQVCLEVGFSSLGSFSSLFARRVGLAPSAYRRGLRTQVAVGGDLIAVPYAGCFALMAGPAGLAIFEKHQRRYLASCGPSRAAIHDARSS